MSNQTGDLGRRASRGALVTLRWQILKVTTQLASTILLARLLDPHAFGLMSMLLVFAGVADVFRDMGLSQAAVQARTLSHGQKSNLFWVNALIGAILTCLTILGAPLVGAFYHQPDLVGYMRILAPVFLINGVSTQFVATLNREMRFGVLNVVNTVPQVVALIVAVLWAVVRPSALVLVAQQLMLGATTLALAVSTARWRPGFPSRGESIRALVKFGLGRLGTQVLDYSTQNVDNLAIGRTYGAYWVGLYSKAYQVLMLPINQLLVPITQVALPVLARLQGDDKRFMRVLHRGQLVGGLAASTIYGIGIGLAEPLVLIIFGDSWLAMVPTFQLLAIGGVFRALHQVAYWTFLARGLTGEQLRFNLISQPVIVLLLFCGLPWGTEGVAVGHSVGYILFWLSEAFWVGRVSGLNFRPLIASGLGLIAAFHVPVLVICLMCSVLLSSSVAALASGVGGTCLWYWILWSFSKRGRAELSSVLDFVRLARA